MIYKEHLRNWLSGISSEIYFWEKLCRGECSCSKRALKYQADPAGPFVLNQYIDYDTKEDFLVADIGSGPFSRIGKVSNKVNLKIVPIDPLAEVYENIKAAHSINSGAVVNGCYVELLDRKYSANTFDMVHMSNSLDHCFDPLYGIKELVYICKLNGKIILRHHENEAADENYAGFHQWNLSLHNKENSFIIWRGDERIDVCKELAEWCDFDLIPDCKETTGDEETGIATWEYNTVIIKKKKDIELDKNLYYDDMVTELNRFILNNLYAGVLNQIKLENNSKESKIKRIIKVLLD